MRSWLILISQMAIAALLALVLAIAFNAGASPRRHLPWLGLLPGLREASSPDASKPALKPQPVPEPTLKPKDVVRSAEPVPKPSKSPTGDKVSKPSPANAPAEPIQAASDWGEFGIREITSLQAFAAFKAGLPFLDARRSEDFEAGHIQGAHCLPVWESNLDEHLIRFEASANATPETPLVIYCAGGGCDDSHLLANRLRRMGYRRLWIYTDGFPDWKAQNRPAAKGAFQGKK